MDFLLLLLIEINCQSLNKVCLIYEVRLYYKAGERYAQMNDFGLILSGRNIFIQTRKGIHSVRPFLFDIIGVR